MSSKHKNFTKQFIVFLVNLKLNTAEFKLRESLIKAIARKKT